jgi:hypothetical protein
MTHSDITACVMFVVSKISFLALCMMTAMSAGATTEQVLQLNNERFMVPEALFHPSDIGLNQAGKQEGILGCHWQLLTEVA